MGLPLGAQFFGKNFEVRSKLKPFPHSFALLDSFNLQEFDSAIQYVTLGKIVYSFQM